MKKATTEPAPETKPAPKKLAQKQGSKRWWKVAGWALSLCAWVFISVLVAQVVVLLTMQLVGLSVDSPVVSGVYSLTSYALALTLIIVVPSLVAKKWPSLELLGLKKGLTWTDIGLAPVGYVVAALGAAGLTAIFSLFPWFNADEVQDVGFSIYMNGGERAIAFIVLVVLAPVVEEVIFRGWLYGKLRTRINAPVAILLVSLLFGLVHGQWNVGVDVFALSVVLCILREITGTTYAGILTHMIKNGIAFYLLYVLVV